MCPRINLNTSNLQTLETQSLVEPFPSRPSKSTPPITKSIMSKVTKYALITGCSLGGIGDSLAQAFHKQGVHVFATARSLDKIAHLKKLGMTTLELDVLSSPSIDAALSSIASTTGGKLDFLVNNSGRGECNPTTHLLIQSWLFPFQILANLEKNEQATTENNRSEGRLTRGSLVQLYRPYEPAARHRSGNRKRDIGAERYFRVARHTSILCMPHLGQGQDHQHRFYWCQSRDTLHW